MLVESLVLSVLQEPSSELLLIRDELSLDESSSQILLWRRKFEYIVSKEGEPSAQVKLTPAPETVDSRPFTMVVFPLSFLFKSEDTILFLIDLGALGEHLPGGSESQGSMK